MPHERVAFYVLGSNCMDNDTKLGQAQVVSRALILAHINVGNGPDID